MATQNHPPFARRRLGRRLRALREQAKLTLDEAALRLDKTRSALHRIEKGETRADVHLVRSMMDIYDHYDPNLIEQVRTVLKNQWWQAFGVQDMGYVDLETEACLVRELALLHVPGLLQTEAYVRAVFHADRVRRTKKELENQVAVRLIRQKRLVNEQNPLELVTIIDEAALRKPVGGPEVMREQLRHLIEMAALPTVTLQVLPDGAGAHVGMNGAFIVLEFPEPDDPEMLYIEYPTGALHIEAEDEVQEAKLVFNHLRSEALSPKDSLVLIEQVVAERYRPERKRR